MEKARIISSLKRFKELKGDTYDIVRIGLFGSRARDMTHNKSDIDVVVVLGKPDMFNLIGIKQDLEEEFKCSVDLIRHREKMNPFLKKRIDKEAIYV
ncbi:nucleotidyltransferase family protein [Thermodesulfobacteriota bacterium]